jgi:hypothetical protein
MDKDTLCLGVDSVHKSDLLGPVAGVSLVDAERIRSLIAEADATVVLKKRHRDPARKHTWRLKFMDHANTKGQGPVYEISKVSRPSLPFYHRHPLPSITDIPFPSITDIP